MKPLTVALVVMGSFMAITTLTTLTWHLSTAVANWVADRAGMLAGGICGLAIWSAYLGVVAGIAWAFAH